MTFPLEDVPEDMRPIQCLACGAPPTCADITPMGQIYYGLCEKHKNLTMALSFGPQFMENATMELVPPNDT